MGTPGTDASLYAKRHHLRSQEQLVAGLDAWPAGPWLNPQPVTGSHLGLCFCLIKVSSFSSVSWLSFFRKYQSVRCAQKKKGDAHAQAGEQLELQGRQGDSWKHVGGSTAGLPGR